jgi:CheY-like chemotaxis protein
MHVLLCEDDATGRAFLTPLLESLGCRVSQATEGDAALRAQAADPADVLLTDLVMPGKDGLETIRIFRRQFPKVRVVAMSGAGVNGPGVYLEMAQRLGAAAILSKPFTPESLREALGLPAAPPSPT